MALMQKAQAQAAGFQKPDISQFVPEGVRDVVDRVVAAGMKVMYSPQMRDEVVKAVQSDEPVASKLAQNTVGLAIMLDQKTEGGIPMEALFPIVIGLMGEAADVLQAAGETVTMEDFNEAARMAFVIIGKKMGASDDDIMGAAQQHADMGDDEGVEQEAPPEPAEEMAGGEPVDSMQMRGGA